MLQLPQIRRRRRFNSRLISHAGIRRPLVHGPANAQLFIELFLARVWEKGRVNATVLGGVGGGRRWLLCPCFHRRTDNPPCPPRVKGRRWQRCPAPFRPAPRTCGDGGTSRGVLASWARNGNPDGRRRAVIGPGVGANAAPPPPAGPGKLSPLLLIDRRKFGDAGSMVISF